MSRSCFYICVSIEAYQVLPSDVYYLIYLSYLQYLPTLAAAASEEGTLSCLQQAKLHSETNSQWGQTTALALLPFTGGTQAQLTDIPSSHTTQPFKTGYQVGSFRYNNGPILYK